MKIAPRFSTWRGAMPDIPFLDLKRVNARRAGELRQAMATVIELGCYVAGPEVELFEQDFARYCGTRHCVAVGNGFDALRLQLQASGLKRGDEVLVPANTFIATILAIVAAGLQPVPVEPDPCTFLMDSGACSRVHHGQDPGDHRGSPLRPLRRR